MLISVVTVSLNSVSTLEKTIQSVLNQSYESIEHIVIDGDSKDGTAKILDKYQNKISKIVSEPDSGLYDAMNKGIKMSSGEVICILNSDDFYADTDILSYIAQAFAKKQYLEAVLTNVRIFKSESNKLIFTRDVKAKWFKPQRLRYGWMPPHPGMFLKSHVYNHLGLYKQNYKIAADYEFFVRAFMVHKTSYEIHNVCSVNMKEGGISQKGWKSTAVINKEIVKACRENKIYTNSFVVMLRLPIKWFLKKIFQYSQKNNKLTK